MNNYAKGISADLLWIPPSIREKEGLKIEKDYRCVNRLQVLVFTTAVNQRWKYSDKPIVRYKFRASPK